VRLARDDVIRFGVTRPRVARPTLVMSTSRGFKDSCWPPAVVIGLGARPSSGWFDWAAYPAASCEHPVDRQRRRRGWDSSGRSVGRGPESDQLFGSSPRFRWRRPADSVPQLLLGILATDSASTRRADRGRDGHDVVVVVIRRDRRPRRQRGEAQTRKIDRPE